MADSISAPCLSIPTKICWPSTLRLRLESPNQFFFKFGFSLIRLAGSSTLWMRGMTGKKIGLEGTARLQYEERGYYFPVQVLENSEAGEFRARFIDHLERNREKLRALPPKDQYVILSETHTY